MSKRHDDVFNDVLSGLDRAPSAEPDRQSGTRFLKRRTGLTERADTEEKTLRWVDPDNCRMWRQHNRDYDLLNEENCADLIEGMRAQGQQEFPAIVRKLDPAEGHDHEYEVICGARRHWTVSWLRANNYPKFRFLIDVRELTDEEAFRLADIENRDRRDISDYERAIDYSVACMTYYGGSQKEMASRLEVSPTWLSRYLQLAKLPGQIVVAYGDKTLIKERHARALRRWMATPEDEDALFDRCRELVRRRETDRAITDGQAIFNFLNTPEKKAAAPKEVQTFKRAGEREGIKMQRSGRKIRLEFDEGLSREAIKEAFSQFMAEHYPVRRR
ncbi:chromosome partitioning protein, ParB family [Monaibacterium marinum]|uniref:Chromosome partitioning protein, ParB family n=1 Tax=Pontivivens marinum TaxID=1690039 RepID=A0A2C9CRG8_9RHOB|nr:ParB/RepB/Spo0J family partition protein [Monaibacterium marinum]SOH93847.1 chromosome partitioning protein, ParB family [Monaibacterium marinum]